MFRKPLSIALIVTFFLTSLGPIPKAHADVLNLPIPGTMVSLSPAYEPVMIKGLTVHKDNPFLFDFIVDVGEDLSASPRDAAALRQQGEKLIKYFLASLAIPEKDLWVNLSPYEKDRTIPEELSQTDMGRDLLAQDYILKQITASLIYPEKALGKTFWDKVYSKAQQLYGTTEVPVNTFNKVWIMADRAEVFEHNQTAFVTDSHLKVMLEEDYLALAKHQRQPGDMSPKGGDVSPSTLPSETALNAKATQRNAPNALASQIVRDIILPELEKEVNTGKNFANLRQIFNSLILASWYKKNLKEALLNQVYSNQSKVKGIERLSPPNVSVGGPGHGVSKDDIQVIYEQYLAAYKKGVFNFIKEDVTATGITIPRKYFSGGMQIAPHDLAMTSDPQKLANALPHDRALVSFQTGMMDHAMAVPLAPDRAMASERKLDQIRKRIRNGWIVFGGGVATLIAEIINAHFGGTSTVRSNLSTVAFLSIAAGLGIVIWAREARKTIRDEDMLRARAVELFGPVNVRISEIGERVLRGSWSGEDFFWLRKIFYRNVTLLLRDSVNPPPNRERIEFALVDTLLNKMLTDLKMMPKVADIIEDMADQAKIEATIHLERADFGLKLPSYAGDQEKHMTSARIAWFLYAKLMEQYTKNPYGIDVEDDNRLSTFRNDWFVVIEDSDLLPKQLLEDAQAKLRELASSVQGPIAPDRAMAAKPRTLDGMTDIEVERMAVRIKQSMKFIEGIMKSADSIVQQKSRLTPKSTRSLQEARKILELYLDTWKIDLGKLETVITGSPSRTDYQIIARGLRDDIQKARSSIKRIEALLPRESAAAPDRAMTSAENPGGIDLNTNGMNWKVRKDPSTGSGQVAGVEMNIDPAMIERIKREGIESLTPVIFRVTPVVSIWPLVGLEPPKRQEERLAGVGA